MNIPPKISVIMPLYNKEADVFRSINSVLNQTVTDWELVVVNDGSTDRGAVIVRSVDDRRLRIFDQVNQGVSAARNRGIAEARADLVAFLDADDEWEPDFLETILRLKDKFPDCHVYATSYFFVRSDGQKRRAILRGVKSSDTEFRMDNYFEVAVQSDPPLWTSAVAVSKKAIAKVGGFPVGVKAGEDLLTWARLALVGQIAYASESKSCFYIPIDSDAEHRVPQIPDYVGDGLGMLRESAPMIPEGLKEYIGIWHKMRAVSYLQLGNRQSALCEVEIAKEFLGSRHGIFVISLIARLPQNLALSLYLLLRRVKRMIARN